MKLYLSSYRIGDHGEDLAYEIAGDKRVGVVFNALDLWEDGPKFSERVNQELQELKSLGLNPERVDLTHYFDGAHDDLRQLLDELDALWVTGGNSFVLRRAFRESGLDRILLAKQGDEAFLYGGYSAGIIVITPTLRGIHLMDDPDTVPRGYPLEVVWDGLSIVPYSIVPHYRSDHHETELAEKSVKFMINEKIPFVALRDGDVLRFGFES